MVVDSVVQSSNAGYAATDSLLRKKYSTENSLYSKKFNTNFKSKYQGNEFDYSKIKPHDSLLNRIKRRISQLIDSIFGSVNPMKSLHFIEIFVRVVAIILAAVALYFLFKFLASKNGNLVFGKKNNKATIEAYDQNENIHEINFAAEIARFELEKKFRLAIRYRFLWTLKKLNDQKIIHWDIEKTNKDFVKALQNTEYHSQFVQLVHIFDFVWYGDFSINEVQYRDFQSKFENFLR